MSTCNRLWLRKVEMKRRKTVFSDGKLVMMTNCSLLLFLLLQLKWSIFFSATKISFTIRTPFINAASGAAPTYPLVDDIQESERRELPKEWIKFEQILGVQHNYANEESEDGLTLSLSLQQPPSIQPTSNNNNTSFISEISEAISYRSRISNNNNVEDLLGCSTKNHCIDLELSISLCGT
ncbi:hypothetical protein Leryth_008337 [Lithospermum erythrorhizon]|nr:hypothetical protein Leryth_008337 [Lithospermum erythrorhizon]